MMLSVIREKFGEHLQGHISPIHIFSLPVVPERDPDINEEDRQAFQDILAASAKGQAATLIFWGAANARIDQDKTTLMAHSALKLGRYLCLLDCQNLVEKYIGETEKNLNRLIADAESNNWILFFDEADALFGKRSQREDHHDKYPNSEVSHLLDTVMKHKGLLILSINNKQTLETVKRRIKRCVQFR